MLQRIVGILLAIFGLTIVVLGGYGLYETNSMAANLAIASHTQGVAFDPLSWASHWRISSLSLLVLGAAVAAAGVVCARKRAWGLLLLAAIALFVLATQWLLEKSGFAQYPFEAMNPWESISYVAIAVAAVFAFFVRRNAGT